MGVEIPSVLESQSQQNTQFAVVFTTARIQTFFLLMKLTVYYSIPTPSLAALYLYQFTSASVDVWLVSSHANIAVKLLLSAVGLRAESSRSKSETSQKLHVFFKT